MATTEEYKNGGSASYSFSIEYIKAEDIKVTVDGTALTYTATNPPAQTTEYTVNGSNVIFKQASVSGSTNGGVRIYRETELENSDSVTFQPGSSIRAADLNANHKLVRFSAQEKNQEIVTADIRDSAVTSAKILDGTIVEGDIANSAITSNKIADNAITTTEILNGQVTRAKLEADIIDGTKIADNAVDSEHYTDGSIDRVHLEADIIDSTKLADNAVNSEHYVDGSIDRVHLEADIIDSTKLADDAVGSEHIQTNAVTDSEIATGTLDNRYFTETELTNGALDGRYFTETESDARYFNVSTGDTIKDGDTFPDNDSTIATTAAINDRIIDLVDDVGGFVPIANETSFPTANPDVNGGAGTIVSVKAASTNLAPSGTTVTIANGRGSGLAVIITGVSATIPSGFGFLVETTTTDHTYAFHRLVPKATEVTTVAGSVGSVNTVAGDISNVNAVAGNATNINTVAGINANVTTVAGISSNVTSVANNESNINAVQGNATNINAVAGNNSNITAVANNASNINSAVSNASNINSAVSNASNITTVAGSISNVNTTATNIASVNTTASNIADVNNFADRYQIASNNPSTDGGGNALAAGDLYFNTSANELKVYNGSSWQAGVTATGNFASTTGNTFTGDNRYNDGVKALFGTGSDLQIFHNGSHSNITNSGTGRLYLNAVQINLHNQAANENMIKAVENAQVELYYDNSKKFQTTSGGATVTGTLTATSFSGETLVGDTSPQLGGDLDANSKNIFFGDSSSSSNNRIKFGTTTADLQIYHDGTNSRVAEGGTGNLMLTTAGSQVHLYNTSNSEDLAKFISNGAVELYHNGSKKFETTSSGVTVTGQLSTTDTISTVGNLDMSDSTSTGNNRIRLGTGDDLEIFHDGTDSLLKNLSGETRIQCANIFKVTNYQNTETYIKGSLNGNVELYHDNIKRIETTNSGISVAGNIIQTGNLNINDNANLNIGNSGDLQLSHDGTHSYITESGSGNLYLRSSQIVLQNAAGNEDLAILTQNGAVKLYYDNSKKVETTSGGFKVFNKLELPDGGATGTSARITVGTSDDLKIYHDGSNSFIDDSGTGNLVVRSSTIAFEGAPGSGESLAKFIQDGAVELYHNNSKKLNTASNGGVLTGDWTVTSDLFLNDGGELVLGTGGDLKLYHDGANSYIDNTGKLYIRGGTFVDIRGTNNETMIKGTPNGSVELYYDNAKKLETYSGGLNVTGYLNLADSQHLRFGAGNDLQIYHSGTESWIKETGTGNLHISASSKIVFQNGAVNEVLAEFIENGAIELYYDNSKKVETDSHGLNVVGNNDIRFENGNWTGDACKIQQHSSFLYISGGSNGIVFREGSTDRWYIDGSGHLDPATDSTYDIGENGKRVRNIYADNYYGDGSNLTGVGGTNTPSFKAYLSASSQSVSNASTTKVQANAEVFDTDGCYNTTNYRFTPTTAGRYYIFCQVQGNSGTGNFNRLHARIYKNGGQVAVGESRLKNQSQTWTNTTESADTIQYANGSSDYFEFYADCRSYSGGGNNFQGGTDYETYWGAFKLIE